MTEKMLKVIILVVFCIVAYGQGMAIETKPVKSDPVKIGRFEGEPIEPEIPEEPEDTRYPGYHGDG